MTVIAVGRLSKRRHNQQTLEMRDDLDFADKTRPKTLGECERRGLGSQVPCPYLLCAYNNLIEVTDNGNVKVSDFVDLNTGDINTKPVNTCALAFANRNPSGQTLENVAAVFGITRERTRQVEDMAMITCSRAILDDLDVNVDVSEIAVPSLRKASEILIAQDRIQGTAYSKERVLFKMRKRTRATIEPSVFEDRSQALETAEKQALENALAYFLSSLAERKLIDAFAMKAIRSRAHVAAETSLREVETSLQIRRADKFGELFSETFKKTFLTEAYRLISESTIIESEHK